MRQKPFAFGVQVVPGERLLCLIKKPRREGGCPQGILSYGEAKDGPVMPVIFSMRRYARRAINRTKEHRKRHELFPDISVVYKIVPLMLHGADSDDALLETALKVLQRVEDTLELDYSKAGGEETFESVALAIKMLKGRKKRRLK